MLLRPMGWSEKRYDAAVRAAVLTFEPLVEAVCSDNVAAAQADRRNAGAGVWEKWTEAYMALFLCGKLPVWDGP